MDRLTAARAELSEALCFLHNLPPDFRQHVVAAIEHVERANRLLGEGTDEGTKP